MRSLRHPLGGVMALVLGGALLVSPGNMASAAAGPGCAKAAHPGGEWRVFGQDATNARSQPKEKEITAESAAMIAPKWKFSIASVEGDGNFQSTPVVADGCLYVGTNTGWIFALNADTGEVVWKTSLSADDPYGLAGLSGGVFSLAVGDGKVYGNVSTSGSPYVVALDSRTGRVLWKTIATKDSTAYTNSSPALINDMVFIGISGPEDGPEDERHPGGWAFVDADTGKLITRRYTVPKRDDARGIKGASLWGTPAFSSKTGYLYDGTGQPANKDREHTLSNAIVKIDGQRNRRTFASIVDSYRGDHDDREDVDFGSSPTLIRDSKGREIVVSIQKSGKLHALYTDSMEQAWWNRLSDRMILGNTTSGAFDGKSFFITANTQTGVPGNANAIVFGNKEPNPGYLYALNPDDGTVRWKAPVAGGVEYHLLSVGGGVVWVVTTHGLLLGFDTSNGLPVAARSVAADANDACVNLSSGAIIARNMIYAVCDVGAAGSGWVVAYGV